MWRLNASTLLQWLISTKAAVWTSKQRPKTALVWPHTTWINHLPPVYDFSSFLSRFDNLVDGYNNPDRNISLLLLTILSPWCKMVSHSRRASLVNYLISLKSLHGHLILKTKLNTQLTICSPYLFLNTLSPILLPATATATPTSHTRPLNPDFPVQ